MTADEMRHLLAEALWRIDTGGDSPPLSQASSSSHRTYARAATDLLPTVRAIAATAYGQGRDDEAAGLPISQEHEPRVLRALFEAAEGARANLEDRLAAVRDAHDWGCDCELFDPCRVLIALNGGPSRPGGEA